MVNDGNWWGDTDNKIINIPISNKPPSWASSTPTPEWQLRDLGQKGPFVSQYTDYNYDKKLANFLKGKRIAYVCPSSHLQGLKDGEKIDSYDLVVRVNQAYHMPESDWEDYGKRTDVLMNCLNINKINSLNENIDYAKSLKYIICPMVSMWDIQRVHDFLNNIGQPWHNVCDGHLFKIFKEVGTTCNTGLTGLITLLNYDVKEVYLTGMTFFNMNKFGKVYGDTYHDAALKGGNFSSTTDKQPLIKDLRMDIHHQQPQIDYFHKIIAYHYMRKLTLDDYLLENFSKSVKFIESKYKGKK
tara:strand:- start:615 stop:1511 length:897 start_codon:yes stop_codon:yes gene_type:complete